MWYIITTPSRTLTFDPLKPAGLISFVILVVIIWTPNHKWYKFHLGAPLGSGGKHVKRLVYIAFLVNSQLFCRANSQNNIVEDLNSTLSLYQTEIYFYSDAIRNFSEVFVISFGRV